MIIGSCGHKLNNIFGNQIVYNDIDKFGNKCKISSTVCDKCLAWYIKEMNAKIIEDIIENSITNADNYLEENLERIRELIQIIDKILTIERSKSIYK